MTAVLIVVGPEQIEVTGEGFTTTGPTTLTLPIGITTLIRQHLHSDPPRPEELTNAIGTVIDHLDDLIREHPGVLGRTFAMRGVEIEAVAAVEAGSAPSLPFVIDRAASEDVFRTLATEAIADRRRNPGLEAHLAEGALAGSCVVVALMRRMQLDEITVQQ